MQRLCQTRFTHLRQLQESRNDYAMTSMNDAGRSKRKDAFGSADTAPNLDPGNPATAGHGGIALKALFVNPADVE